MIKFSHLDKKCFDAISPQLFGILYDNMQTISPSGKSREEEYREWIEAVGDGLKADARQIIIIENAGEMIGFFQYYINAGVFMMEEIQLVPAVFGKGVFRRLYGFILSGIDTAPALVEAYADRNNAKSIAILRRLGLSPIEDDGSGEYLHFRGSFADLQKWYYDGQKN